MEFLPKPSKTEPSVCHHKPIALVIHETPEVSNAIAENLKIEGFETMTAPDGKQGLAEIRNCKPNLIIIGTDLPMLDGYQFTRMIKFDRKFRQTLVLVAVTDEHSIDTDLAKAAGADGFIHRPFGPEAIMEELRRVFQERKPAKRETEEKAAESAKEKDV